MRTAWALAPLPVTTAAILGEVASWTVRSSRDPGVLYTVTLYPDGHWECSCPAFDYHSRADGLCKHIDAQRAAWDIAPVFAEVGWPDLSW
jgi:SWIM zinc finger